MTLAPFLVNCDTFPRPADADRARLGLARWAERAGEEPALAGFMRTLADEPAGRALLEALFGNSPYLTALALREPATLADFLARGPDAAVAAVLAGLAPEPAEPGVEPERMRTLRVAKRRAALLIALADIGGLWPLERVTGALSAVAEAALRAAAAHLLAEAAAAGTLRLAVPDEPERDSGWVILAMGKLGARELNYSSDIDLFILYDNSKLLYMEKDIIQRCFVRLTRNLVNFLEKPTEDGYVFRTDLRLRPDPGATPLAMSLDAAETYYESLGQNWERAAMIKARPVAGDIEAGERFLGRLRPFLWRKHLDFAAIQDIHSIKRQIQSHRGGGTIRVAGHNIKLGRGGIREIEFFAQTQQLIWGGRDASVRGRETVESIAALAAAGHVDGETAAALTAAYRYLRRVEHRLQMIEDRQTHTLPADPAGLAHLATFLGYPDPRAFADELIAHLRRVERAYAELFEDSPALGGPGSLVFTGTEDDPETLKTLARMGYAAPSIVAQAVRRWHHGRYRAIRSARARELLTEVMPRLLEAFSRTPQPDAAFARFDGFLSRLPTGVQLFSLIHANPHLLDLIADLMGTSARVADYLARHPAVIEIVLEPDFRAPPPGREALAEELAAVIARAAHFEEVLDDLRRWANERKFQVAVKALRGDLDAEAAGAALADIADAVLAGLMPHVEAEFASRHGRLPGPGMAIAALGRLGGREMTATSDLDLIFLYDPGAGAETSDGPRPLAPAHYFARLSQRFLAALTAATAEGSLYEIDLRLRPSGAKGPLAVSIERFERYQAENAWTWEHMALTRARLVAGPPGLRRRVEATIRGVLTRPRDPAKLLLDVAEMRERLARERPTASMWEAKDARGGLLDVEFIAQYLQLLHAPARPEVLRQNTIGALRALADAGALEARTAETLVAAARLLAQVQALLRLTVSGAFDAEIAPEGLKKALARATGRASFESLSAALTEATAGVRQEFARLIEDPARALPRPREDPDSSRRRAEP
ncbi:MAG: bifunctional [glutamine synthetase] adenylyltransferase/[glutamine synthetase]-adenylyl-L-tyrosine phosphorylase [Proteobacteria bacterium]|nr:bifunctional [glutamine synthetase] adenylyltransferase/[glutamine synthetase]-adenylyl-L-tyrosine phosphorylase [Pseudomonadota bacterium]